MNLRNALSIVTLALFMLDSCNDGATKPATHDLKAPLTIEWSDGVALYSVVYKIDGRIVGRGERAYKHVIEVINSLPDESIVVVRRPADIAGFLLDATGADSPFPFDGRRAEEIDFQSLSTRKRISVAAETFVQPEFLGERPNGKTGATN